MSFGGHEISLIVAPFATSKSLSRQPPGGFSHENKESVLGENRVEILAEEAFQTGDADFSRQLARIAAMDPDALFVSALSQETAGILSQTVEPWYPETIQVIAPDLTMVEVQVTCSPIFGPIDVRKFSVMDLPPSPGQPDNVAARER